MSKAIFEVPLPYNEPVTPYAPGDAATLQLHDELARMESEKIEIFQRINGKKVGGKSKRTIRQPHDHKKILGSFYRGTKSDVSDAIDAALKAREQWAATSWEHRASIFLRAADLLSGPYRARMNAATMLGQSKTAYQAEIDATAEFCDFLRFNATYMQQIYEQQPESEQGIWNRLTYRPLEGFVFAITPFNFTSIAGNLCAAPAMLGNVCVWKPAETQIYSAHVIMDLFEEAGLPPGVINLVFTDGPAAGDVVFKHPDFAGLHFTGSTKVFKELWGTIGANINLYKTYPRIVGETGGKDFVIAHKSSDPEQVAVALLRGAFEFQGQKCSAASRAYLPKSLWPKIKKRMVADMKTLKMGTPTDFTNFLGAVIDERAFDRITAYIERAKADKKSTIIAGGGFDKSEGYFIEPTVIVTTDPHSETMEEELFGPVLTIYVYADKDWKKALKLVDSTSPYALTGAVFANDRYAITEAEIALENAAGNFYINDKPTGAVVGQQPFGGARGSGTNDKAGSILNLYRWLSPRLIKENLNPPRDYRYPFLAE
jgi:1-pyrroline-5-carboxylate dehydrogenase